MPKLNEFEASTGYVIRYRTLALDIQAKIQAAVRAEWAKSDDPAQRPPEPPVEQVEVGPGQFEAVARDKHPDHLNALAAYDARVQAEVNRRTLRLVSDYAIQVDVDADAVRAHRAALAAIGVDYSDESDRDLFLWHIAVPDSDEQQQLSGKIFGTYFAAYVEAQRRAFRSQVEGQADRVLSLPAR